MPENQEEKEQGHGGGPRRVIGGISNVYGTGKTILGLGKTAAAIFAGPEVWVIITIVGIVIIVFILIMAIAPVPISPTSPMLAPTTAVPTQTP